MRFEILLRTKNLKSLYFGMILAPEYWCTSGYDSFMNNVQSTLGFGTHLRGMVWKRKPVGPFLLDLTQLQLLGDIRDDNEPFSAELLECFLGITSLRTIKYFHDDGNWDRVDPYGSRFKETPGKPLIKPLPSYHSINDQDMSPKHFGWVIHY